MTSSLRGRFDQAIVLPGSFKSALLPWFARIPRRTGYTGEQRFGLLNDRRSLDKAAQPYHLQRVAALALEADDRVPSLEQIPWPQLSVDKDACEVTAAEYAIDPDKPLVALCPGAEFGPAKQWPAAHFAEVARAQLDRGRQVAVFGSAKDRLVAREIVDQAHGVIDLTGKTSLGEAIDLMSMAQQVVTNDSGLMHIAAAVGSHVIALYGSSSDNYTPPLAQGAERLSLQLSCQPCFQRVCPLQHLNCLNKLEPARVNTLLQ